MDSDLDERNFFQEGLRRNPGPFWFWLLVCILVTSLAWYFSSRVEEEKEIVYGSTPFLQVTNRQFSLFLWQNPEFMRSNLKGSRHYLTAWEKGITVDPSQAENWVDAPDEALFMYHVWQRLLGDYYYPRKIMQDEFVEFLKSDSQWLPQYWPKATDAYRTLIKWIEEGSNFFDLKELSYQELPLEVRQAFVGWKNYTKESEAINQIRPTYRQVWTFVDYYPNFKRPFWINLVRHDRPDYLLPVSAKGNSLIPESEMDGLLQMGLYNYLNGTAQKPSS